MALIGEMQYLTIGDKTYSIASGGGTVTSVGISNATNGGLTVSGSPITGSGSITIGHTNVLISAQTTQALYPIKIDKNGHISAYGSAVTSLPASDVSDWAKASTKPTYTYSEVGAAASSHAHGNITSGGDITATAPTIASGDQIIINDHSASKITNGPTFDGSTTTTALTPKGTWETFSKFSGSYNDLSNKPTIPTVPTNVSAFTNDSGYITSADVPEGASAYTGTISAVGTSASTGTNNGFARGDHVHNITSSTITSALGYTPYNSTNPNGYVTTDEKLKWTASTSSNTYYPLQSTSTATTSTANTLNGVSFYQYYNTAGGYRRLDLGNSTAYKSSGGAYGTIRLYGAAATYYGDLVPGVLGTTSGDGHISANRTWTLPDKTGTIALTSDIPDVSGFITSDSDEKLAVEAVVSGRSYQPLLAQYGNYNAAIRQYDDTGIYYFPVNGTANGTDGEANLTLGNNISSNTAGWKKGILTLYGTNNYGISLISGAPTANRTITLPDKTGTVALTSDIPDVSSFITDAGVTKITTTAGTHTVITNSTGAVSFNVPTKTSHLTNDSGFLTSYTDTKVSINLTNPTSGTWYYPTWHTSTSGTEVTLKANNGLAYCTLEGTTNADGYGLLQVGNNVANGTAGNKRGALRIYSKGTGYTTLYYTSEATSTSVSQYFPATEGTVLNTGTTSFTQTVTSGTAIGTIKINNTDTIIYAPNSTNVQIVRWSA